MFRSLDYHRLASVERTQTGADDPALAFPLSVDHFRVRMIGIKEEIEVSIRKMVESRRSERGIEGARLVEWSIPQHARVVSTPPMNHYEWPVHWSISAF